MKDVIVVGAGLAGLSAAWRMRHWDTLVLEADSRVGGRIRSERRGQYWLNWGGHVFAGPGSSTDSLLNEVGVLAVAVPGSLQGLQMNGKFIRKGHIATYPFRIPMSFKARLATLLTGIKVVSGVARYTAVVRQRPGESGPMRQQRVYDFDNERSFLDFIKDQPEDAAALFKTTVTRSAGDMDQISAGSHRVFQFGARYRTGPEPGHRGRPVDPHRVRRGGSRGHRPSSAPGFTRWFTGRTQCSCATSRTARTTRPRPGQSSWRQPPMSHTRSPLISRMT